MNFTSSINTLYQRLTTIGEWLGLMPLRLFIGWEFYNAGTTKLQGSNWFDRLANDFPFPFSIIPTDATWFLVTWAEIIGAMAIVIGFATRFWIATLIILDVVAWTSVHADHGYNVCDDGYKLALIYLVMMVPLLLKGPDKLSLDHLISRGLRV